MFPGLCEEGAHKSFRLAPELFERSQFRVQLPAGFVVGLASLRGALIFRLAHALKRALLFISCGRSAKSRPVGGRVSGCCRRSRRRPRGDRRGHQRRRDLVFRHDSSNSRTAKLDCEKLTIFHTSSIFHDGCALVLCCWSVVLMGQIRICTNNPWAPCRPPPRATRRRRRR